MLNPRNPRPFQPDTKPWGGGSFWNPPMNSCTSEHILACLVFLGSVFKTLFIYFAKLGDDMVTIENLAFRI